MDEPLSSSEDSSDAVDCDEDSELMGSLEGLSKFYVCPLCGNIIRTTGDTLISCCGITLPPLEAEETDEAHQITIEKVEDENFITVNHDMTKMHYISFICYVTSDRVQFVKLYPEGNAETRLNFRGSGYLYIYCNKHGLMKKRV